MAITRKKFGRIIPGNRPEKVELRGYDSYTVTLGDKLRGERATLGKTLDDIQKETRLRIEFLLGIEMLTLLHFQHLVSLLDMLDLTHHI